MKVSDAKTFFSWLSFCFYDTSTFMAYLMPKPSLQKDISGTI